MDEQEILDVLVLGAGLSALTAAYEIQKTHSNVKLNLIEAKNRVGGRSQTVKVDIGNNQLESFDVGGQWVAPSQLDIMELLQELGLETYPQFISGTKVMQAGPENQIRTYTIDIPRIGSIWGLIEFQLFIWKVERLCKKVPIEDPYSWNEASEYDSMSMETFTRKNISTEAAVDVIQAACRTALGTDLSQVSALFFLAYSNSAGGMMRVLLATPDCAQELRVKGGTQQISELLADRVGREKIHLEEPVTHVYQDGHIVTVHTATGKVFRAKHVISGLPPHCTSAIKFSPPLPQNHQLLLESMPVGHLTKFIVTYDKAYWRDAGFSGEVVSNGGRPLLDCKSGPISIVYDATTHNQVAALVGFIAGNQVVEWDKKTIDERQSCVLSSLSEFFGEWALTPTSYTEKKWSEEVYNGGCPVNFGVPGMLHSFPCLRRPHGLVHWCGTETSTHWTGFLSGAVQAGRRAACEVMKINGHDVSVLERLASRKAFCQQKDFHIPVRKTLVYFLSTLSVITAVYFARR